MSLYSLKMRASKQELEQNKHISGAERIVSQEALGMHIENLLNRALFHAKGEADFINMKIEAVQDEQLLRLKALPVRTQQVRDAKEGQGVILTLLEQMGITNGKAILDKMPETYGMRGAMLLNVDTLERLEPHLDRGIRATYMDAERDLDEVLGIGQKNHYEEAIVLATKVAHAPHIIGEICISDDPNYVTGYVASKAIGYVRITKLKEMGSELGGRIFLYRGANSEVEACIQYLEKQKVLVTDCPSHPDLISHEAVEASGKASREDEKGLKDNEQLRQDMSQHIGKDIARCLPDRACKWDFIDEALARLEVEHLYRYTTPLDSAQSKFVMKDGKKLMMLASNSYLDFCNEPRIKVVAKAAISEYGVGSGGSRLTTGTLQLHERLEQGIAAFKGAEAALVFNTGYMANVGIISALCDQTSIIFSDALNHASIIDGCRLSKAKVVIYKHNDMTDLERQIKKHPCKRGLIVSDAVFSMDGDIAPLPAIVTLANRYGLLSMVDEAHATGVIGKGGKGIVSYYEEKLGKQYVPDIMMGTLSKAIGSEGGFVCGQQKLIDYLRNKARSFIFSTSLSPAVLAAALEGVRLLSEEPEHVAALQQNVTYFCKCLQEEGLSVHSETAIVPIVIGDEEKAMYVMQALYERGYYISAIRYPTVARGAARLRVALMATHTKEELKDAAHAIAEVVRTAKKIDE